MRWDAGQGFGKRAVPAYRANDDALGDRQHERIALAGGVGGDALNRIKERADNQQPRVVNGLLYLGRIPLRQAARGGEDKRLFSPEENLKHIAFQAINGNRKSCTPRFRASPSPSHKYAEPPRRITARAQESGFAALGHCRHRAECENDGVPSVEA